MCEWGTYKEVKVTIPAHLSYTKKQRRARKKIDSCIAGLVKALNDSGIITVASCCGHYKRPGQIALADGREIFICPDFETARKIDKLFPPINQ